MGRFLTCWSAEMDNCAVVFEHVHFFNVLEWLHAYIPSNHVKNVNELKFRGGLLTELLDGGLDVLVLFHGVALGLAGLLQDSSLSSYSSLKRGLMVASGNLPFPPI